MEPNTDIKTAIVSHNGVEIVVRSSHESLAT